MSQQTTFSNLTVKQAAAVLARRAVARRQSDTYKNTLAKSAAGFLENAVQSLDPKATGDAQKWLGGHLGSGIKNWWSSLGSAGKSGIEGAALGGLGGAALGSSQKDQNGEWHPIAGALKGMIAGGGLGAGGQLLYDNMTKLMHQPTTPSGPSPGAIPRQAVRAVLNAIPPLGSTPETAAKYLGIPAITTGPYELNRWRLRRPIKPSNAGGITDPDILRNAIDPKNVNPGNYERMHETDFQRLHALSSGELQDYAKLVRDPTIPGPGFNINYMKPDEFNTLVSDAVKRLTPAGQRPIRRGFWPGESESEIGFTPERPGIGGRVGRGLMWALPALMSWYANSSKPSPGFEDQATATAIGALPGANPLPGWHPQNASNVYTPQ